MPLTVPVASEFRSGISPLGALEQTRSGATLGRLTLAVLLACSAPTLLCAQTRVEVSREISDCLNLRSQPNTSARIRDCLDPGTQADVVSSVPYWLKIRLDDGSLGWASKRYLLAVQTDSSPRRPDSVAALTPAPAPPVGGTSTKWLEVHVVDVGQGDGIWIHTPDDGIKGNGVFEGKNIVIDGGPDAIDTRNEMLHYLDSLYHESGRIDALIVTHPHDDHYPGAEGVLRHFQVSDYYDPGYPKDGPKYNNFLQLVGSETANGQPIRLHIGSAQLGTPDWGSELTAEFLYSYPGTSTGLGTGNTLENNASIVLKLTYGNVSFLFMGDAEGKERSDPPTTPKFAERILLNTVGPARLKSTVLKIAHHGSETSSTLPFIDAVDPEIVLVSWGRKSFGGTFIPDRTTLQRYCAHNPQIRIYRTDQDDEAQHRTTADDQDGDHIVVRTNGTVVQVQAYADGQPMPTPTSCTP